MATYYPQTVIYEEKKTSYWALAFILIFVCFIIFYGYKMRTLDLWIRLLPLIPLLFVIFVCYNIAFYSVKVFDDKTLQFGFPAWNKKLQLSEINSIEEIPYHPMREFGGLGWRIGKKDGKWKRGYLVWLQKGIEIETVNGICYVFGTDNPEEILSLLK